MGIQSRLFSTQKKVPDQDTESTDTGAGEVIDLPQKQDRKFWQIKLPQNKRSLHEWLVWLEASPSDGLSLSQMFLYSEDLRPVETHRRTWRWYNFVNVWIADAINVNSWQIAGTGVQNGLTWWETWLAIWVGYLVSGLMIMWTSRVGSYAHICFPVATRASFGVYGSIWPVINRVVLAIIWFGSQSWILGQLVHLMLISVFGRGVDHHMGTQNLSGTTVIGFVSFFIGWVLQLPAVYLRPETVRHFFTVKAVVAPTVSIAFLIWTLVRANGAGTTISSPKDELPSSDKAWAWINMFMSCLSNYATLIVNAPDFSRFAETPASAQWSQGITIPVAFSITSLIGLLVASASSVFSEDGKPMWNPLDVLRIFVVDGYSTGDRAGVFLISLGLGIAQVGTNVMANSISAGTDLTALLPRFINIRRGGFICAALALCICPWHFFESGSNFTTYLSAYSIFLSSISGVIMADYVWLRRGKMQLFSLYDNNKNGLYMYNTRWGCNWRGFAAYLLALVPTMPGFAGACGRDVPMGATYLYYFNYIVGFIVAFVLYIIFNLISPPDNIPEEIEGRLMDLKAPWLEENLDVDGFSEMYRLSNPIYTQRPEPAHLERAFSSRSLDPVKSQATN